MFSYLEVVKKLVSVEIYNRGVKLYLEGKVLGYKDLLLDYWRRYEIQAKSDTYKVDIPLLHLALDQTKYAKSDEALAQVVRSNSPYFIEFGIDSQIVAVCAALDQEFQITKSNVPKSSRQFAEGVWDKILQVESNKKERLWLLSLEKILHTSATEQSSDIRSLKEMLTEVVDNSIPFPLGFEQLINSIMGDYLLEKNLIRLFANPFFLSKGGVVWWDFIKQFIPKMDIDNQIKLIADLWKNYLAGNTQNFDHKFQETLKSLPQNIKNAVLTSLKNQFESASDKWVEFALISQNQDWLEDHLAELDSKYLVLAGLNFPQRREPIEQKLVQQITIWSNFLQVGDYEQLLKILDLWEQKLGRSDYFEDALKYIRESHPKKTKLVKSLAKYV